VKACRVAAVSFPLLFAALTGRSGHGLARASRLVVAYLLGLYDAIRSASDLWTTWSRAPSLPARVNRVSGEYGALCDTTRIVTWVGPPLDSTAIPPLHPPRSGTPQPADRRLAAAPLDPAFAEVGC
jgi:hypothetical protein